MIKSSSSQSAIEYIDQYKGLLYGFGKKETWDTELGIEHYLYNHYGLQDEQIEFGDSIVTLRSFFDQIARRLPQHLSDKGDSQPHLDIGCGPGGMSRRLAASCQYALGVDLSFLSVFQARSINQCAPFQRASVRKYTTQSDWEEVEIDGGMFRNCDYVVADFETSVDVSKFYSISLLNTLCVMNAPRSAFARLIKLMSDDALLALSSPFYWRRDRSSADEWVSELDCDHASAPELIYNTFGLRLLDSADIVWPLYFYSRYIQLWSSRFYLLKK